MWPSMRGSATMTNNRRSPTPSLTRRGSLRTETSRRASGEFQSFRSKGSRGTRFPLAELRGGSLLSRCWGEASGAGRGQGPAQLSVGNRHLVLGITRRQTAFFMWIGRRGEHDFLKMKKALLLGLEKMESYWLTHKGNY